MKKNIEKLAKIGEELLKSEVEGNFIRVECSLKKALALKDEEDYIKDLRDKLSENNKKYQSLIEECKIKYGIEFRKVQKEYEELLPQINEILGVKVN